MITQTEHIITYVRPESHQIFFIFVGMRERLTIHALDFVRATAIGERNIVFLKDPYGHCYERGISEEHDSLDGIVRWQQGVLASQFPHVREVFCAGTSAGGGAAIHTGCRLRTRAVVSLGGRIGRASVAAERERVAEAFYDRVLGTARHRNLTAEEQARLVEAFKDPEIRRLRWDLSGNPEKCVDPEQIASLVRVVKAHGRGTDLHFYYAITNAIDRQFAEAFRGCPTATLHPITPPPTDWSQDVSFSDPDHGVVRMLYETGQLGSVFAAYL